MLRVDSTGSAWRSSNEIMIRHPIVKMVITRKHLTTPIQGFSVNKPTFNNFSFAFFDNPKPTNSLSYNLISL